MPHLNRLSSVQHASLSDSANNAETVSPRQVLVVVPALNEENAIEDCISSLIGDEAFMQDVRIVVADGGSTDSTLRILKRLQQTHEHLCVIENRSRLQSAGINLAVEACAEPEHAYLVRCDAHAVYPPGFVLAVVNALARRKDAASVVVPMDSVGSTAFARASGWIVETKLGAGGSAHRGGLSSGWVDHGHHAGFRLDWFRNVGGYDPTFSQNEDAEYDHRLGLSGGRVWLEGDIRLDYLMRPTLRSLTKQYWKYGKGRARTVLKHRTRPRIRQTIPVAHAALFVICTILGFFWPAFWMYPAFYFTVIVLVSLVGLKKVGIPDGLWAGPALCAMHLAWGAGFIKQCLIDLKAFVQAIKW